MIRARYALAAALGVSLTAAAVSAQAPAPKFTPILGGKAFTAPIRGEAEVEYTRPIVKREKDLVVDEVTVKNISKAPIARLTVESIYYDKAGAVIAGGKNFVGMLQPGEVQTVRVETPFRAGMNTSNYKFTHANGGVKPTRVDKLENPAAAAAAKTAPRR
jgi:hypothetical protein